MLFNSPYISVHTHGLCSGLAEEDYLPTHFLFLHWCLAIPVLCKFASFPAKQSLAFSLQRHVQSLKERGYDVYSRLHCSMLVWAWQFFWGRRRGRILSRDLTVCFTVIVCQCSSWVLMISFMCTSVDMGLAKCCCYSLLPEGLPQ